MLCIIFASFPCEILINSLLDLFESFLLVKQRRLIFKGNCLTKTAKIGENDNCLKGQIVSFGVSLLRKSKIYFNGF